jgi:cell division septal protein FtsQ
MSVTTAPTGHTQLRARRAVAQHRRSTLQHVWRYYLGVVLVLALSAFALLWTRGWLPGIFAPCRVVVRGCEFTSAERIVAALECDGTQAVPALWARAGSVRKSEDRWLRGIAVSSDWGRTAVVTVRERRPVLLLSAAGMQYWLCDDEQLIARQPEDRASTFINIAALPHISLPEDPGEGKLQGAREYLELAAACEQYVPGQVARLEINRDGEITACQPSGFQLRLGRADNMLERIAALPQVLRVCEGHKDKLRFVYASEVNGTLVFYEKWNGPAAQLKAGN